MSKIVLILILVLFGGPIFSETMPLNQNARWQVVEIVAFGTTNLKTYMLIDTNTGSTYKMHGCNPSQNTVNSWDLMCWYPMMRAELPKIPNETPSEYLYRVQTMSIKK